MASKQDSTSCVEFVGSDAFADPRDDAIGEPMEWDQAKHALAAQLGRRQGDEVARATIMATGVSERRNLKNEPRIRDVAWRVLAAWSRS